MAHSRAEQGHAIPGYKLIAGRATRFFKDETAAEKRLRALGLKKAQMYTSKFVSPHQAEQALKKIGKELGDKDAEKLIGKTVSGTSLVSEDHKSPAVVLPSQRIREIGDRLAAR